MSLICSLKNFSNIHQNKEAMEGLGDRGRQSEPATQASASLSEAAEVVDKGSESKHLPEEEVASEATALPSPKIGPCSRLWLPVAVFLQNNHGRSKLKEKPQLGCPATCPDSSLRESSLPSIRDRVKHPVLPGLHPLGKHVLSPAGKPLIRRVKGRNSSPSHSDFCCLV